MKSSSRLAYGGVWKKQEKGFTFATFPIPSMIFVDISLVSVFFELNVEL